MTKTKEPDNISVVDVLYQDIQHLEEVVHDLSTRLERLYRLTKYDERSAAVGEKQSQNELLQAIKNNTTAVTHLLTQKDGDGSPECDNLPYRMEKRRKRDEGRKRLQHIRRLALCKQEITPVCPCGKHKGLKFIENGVVIEERCPYSWWISQQRLAFEDRRLEQFVKSTPVSKYIRPYMLEKKVQRTT
jgi:hypothetical protein